MSTSPEAVGTTVTSAAEQLMMKWQAKAEDAPPETEAPEAEPVQEAQAPASEPEQPQEAATPTDEGPIEDQEQELADRISVDELAADYGVDKNQFMTALRHTVSTKDGDQEVNLHEALMGYQRGKEHESQMQALEAQRKAFEAETSQKRAQLDGAMSQIQNTAKVVDSMFSQEEQDVQGRYSHTDWARLRASDPGEYSARWTEYQTALQSIATRRQGAYGELQTAANEIQNAQQQAMQERIQEGQKMLTKLIPSWTDEDTKAKEAPKVVKHLKDMGVTDDELGRMTDARIYRLAHDSMRLRELLANADHVRTQAAAPKTAAVKPGVKTSPKTLRRRQARKETIAIRERLKKTGKQEDAVSALTSQWRSNNGSSG